MTGKPRHSESNGGVERRNRTVEENISNWMHENQSKHWAQALPFIQWRCNTQIHRGIGNRTPYHLMFGQNPQVGISSLPISSHLLDQLSTEMEVSRCLGLPDNLPLEEAVLNPALHSEVAVTTKATTNQPITERKSHHYSLGFRTDVTDQMIKRLVWVGRKETKTGSVFAWTHLGRHVAPIFSATVPSHISLTFVNYIMQITPQASIHPASMRKDPPEKLSQLSTKTTPELQTSDDNTPFVSKLVPSSLPYMEDIQHRWLRILVKATSPPDVSTLMAAGIRTCVSVTHQGNEMTGPVRRVVIRKVRKTTWEILDEFGESVLDTLEESGDTGLVEQWGKQFQHPTMRDYKEAVQSNKKRNTEASAKAELLKESPNRKRLRDEAFDSLSHQGTLMKNSVQSKSTAKFSVGDIVQVGLHDVDTTKADGKTLTLVVVDVVKKMTNLVPCIVWHAKQGYLTLYITPAT